jgi:phosphatidylglycerol:prolipoprotein diacylglycerol transferase
MHPVLVHFGPLLVPSYGVCAALGILLMLGLAQWTAARAGLNPRHAWNVLVLGVFSALAVSRLALIVANLSDLRQHPAWLLAIAMVHHPLLAALGAVGALLAAIVYARWARITLAALGDCLAAPVSLGIAAEQLGALLAGSDYGRESFGGWAVTYTSELAARWSGTPLGVPLYPVQAYAALGALTLAAITLVWLGWPRRPGDVAGVGLVGAGALLAATEMLRDWEGRGVLPGGFVDTPQLVGLGMVVAGGLVLMQWRPTTIREAGADSGAGAGKVQNGGS